MMSTSPILLLTACLLVGCSPESEEEHTCDVEECLRLNTGKPRGERPCDIAWLKRVHETRHCLEAPRAMACNEDVRVSLGASLGEYTIYAEAPDGSCWTSVGGDYPKTWEPLDPLNGGTTHSHCSSARLVGLYTCEYLDRLEAYERDMDADADHVARDMGEADAPD